MFKGAKVASWVSEVLRNEVIRVASLEELLETWAVVVSVSSQSEEGIRICLGISVISLYCWLSSHGGV